MKIRTFPEDFIVKEHLNFEINPDGNYSLFRFEKRGWGTFDIISSLSTRFNLPTNEINIAGIKDRHAVTTSYLTIKKRFASRIINALDEDKSLIPNAIFEYIGNIDKPIRSDDISYNNFSLTIRSIDNKEIPLILDRFEIVKNQGVPNYFDDQRFGSARHGLGFVAKSLILGDYESATRLLFSTSKYDNKKAKEAKLSVLNYIFNDKKIDNIESIFKNIPSELKGFFKRIYQNKNDYLSAFLNIDRRYLILLMHAYQSYLFNIFLSMLILNFNDNASNFIIKGETNNYIFCERFSKNLLDLLKKIDLPIPSSQFYNEIERLSKKFNFINQSNIFKIIDDIEKIENLKFEKLDGKNLKIRLNNKHRKGLLIPENLLISDFQDDEFFKGKKKVRLEFNLPKGSYATMIIKGIFLQGKFGKAFKV